jgi:hypothetical protein
MPWDSEEYPGKPSSESWFHILATLNSASMNMGIQLSPQHSDFSPFVFTPIVVIAGPCVVNYLVFEEPW